MASGDCQPIHAAAQSDGSAGSNTASCTVEGTCTSGGTYPPPPTLPAISVCGPTGVRKIETAQKIGRAGHAFTNPANARWADNKSGLSRFVDAALVDLFARVPAMTGATPPAAATAGAAATDAPAVGADGVDGDPAPGGLYGASWP